MSAFKTAFTFGLLCVPTALGFGASKQPTGRNAIIMVDVQKCFLPTGTLPVAEGDLIIPVVNQLREDHDWDLVIVSQDWHSPSSISFGSNHEDVELFSDLKLEYTEKGELCHASSYIHDVASVDCSTFEEVSEVMQTMWPDHCLQNTEDADFAEGFVREDSDVLIQKGDEDHVDSYSVLFDNGGQAKLGTKSTGAPEVLAESGVENIYVVGLAYDFCVFYTAMDAAALGYNVYVVEDATRFIMDSTKAAATEEMLAAGITIINAADVTL